MHSEIRFSHDGGSNALILVPVHVNGEGPYPFILDTGASHCLVSQELASVLTVRPEQDKEAMGAGGVVKLALAHVAAVTVGSMRLDDVPVAVTGELRRIGSAIRSRVDGCLGYSFLKHFILSIDYQRKVLRLGRPSSNAGERRDATAPRIQFKLASDSKPVLLVPVQVNGQGPYQFAVDTGASITVISGDLAATLKLATTGGCAATGGGGQTSIGGGRLRSVSVGGACVRDLAVGIGDFLQVVSTSAGAKLDGIIGYNFLSLFRVTIDYPGSTLELSPAAWQQSVASDLR